MKLEKQTYRGRTFFLQTSGKYFTIGGTAKVPDNPEQLLHRFVWHDQRGAIPKGKVVHHKDGNWRNNCIDNLELMDGSEHSKMHMAVRFQDRTYRARNREVLEKAQEKAKVWHGSEEGKEWHRRNGKNVWKDKQQVEAKCICCGNHYLTFFPTRARFCSHACALRFAYMMNRVEETCVCCGKKFMRYKYRKTRCCSRACSNRSRH